MRHTGIDTIVDERIAIIFPLNAVALLFSDASQSKFPSAAEKCIMDFTQVTNPHSPQLHRSYIGQQIAASNARELEAIPCECCIITTSVRP